VSDPTFVRMSGIFRRIIESVSEDSSHLVLTIFTLFNIMCLRIRVLTFIHGLDDGSAKPKHVVHWYNLRV
jgi:hypothetical protein